MNCEKYFSTQSGENSDLLWSVSTLVSISDILSCSSLCSHCVAVEGLVCNHSRAADRRT